MVNRNVRVVTPSRRRLEINHNTRRRKMYAEDQQYREGMKKSAVAWIDNNYERWLLRQIKLRAKKTGVKFNLTIEDIVIPKRCPVFNIPMRRGKGCSCDNSPTVDRVVANKGYIKGNIAIISRFANSLKGKATSAQHRRIADWIDEHGVKE